MVTPYATHANRGVCACAATHRRSPRGCLLDLALGSVRLLQLRVKENEALLVGRGAPFALWPACAAVAALLLCALLGGGLRTVGRNRDWADEEGLYRSGIQINPPKGKKKNERR